MNNIQALFEVWLYCQTKLEKTLRWSKYIECEKNEELVNCNSIRKQNVAQHTLSKLLVFSMILPDLKKIFSDLVNFELLFSCIVYHDFGEGLRDQKYDILSTDKKNSHDVEEWRLICGFLEENGLKYTKIFADFEKAFLLQFILTSHGSFPTGARAIMMLMRENVVEKNTAILFQIIEKWEYHFYAYENRKKHSTIWQDVYMNQKEVIYKWIHMYEPKFHIPLESLFVV